MPSEPLEVFGDGGIGRVVLAGNRVHFAGLQTREQLLRRVEFGGFRQMRDIAGVNDERRLFGMPFTSSMVLVSVPLTSGFASLLKPICVSLICTNKRLAQRRRRNLLSAAMARSIGVKTPPDSANSVPAPPYAMHFRALRRDNSD